MKTEKQIKIPLKISKNSKIEYVSSFEQKFKTESIFVRLGYRR